MKHFLVCLLIMRSFLSYSQTYDREINKAENSYAKNQYDSCVFYFNNAFRLAEASGSDLYDAAVCNTLNNYFESAFSLLFKAIRKGANISKLKIDPELDALHTSKKWNKLIKTATAIQLDSFKTCQYPGYAKQLADIWELDQYWRFRLGNATRKNDTTLVNALWDKMREADSINDNVKKVERIMDAIGWPTRTKVGRAGATTTFLVFDHASREVMEKYFPMLEKAANEGEASKRNMATMKDRILANRGKKQIYGTQKYWDAEQGKFVFFPIEDPDNINKRRKDVGLEPLDEFPKF